MRRPRLTGVGAFPGAPPTLSTQATEPAAPASPSWPVSALRLACRRGVPAQGRAPWEPGGSEGQCQKSEMAAASE